MKTFDERNENIRRKILRKRKNRKILISCTALGCVLALVLVLFMPYSLQNDELKSYRGSPYYSLIEKLHRFSAPKVTYRNNFEKWTALLKQSGGFGDAKLSTELEAPGDTASPPLSSEDHYQEVTDNQVEGVVEGDLFKRSDRYLYYLRSDRLDVYSIAQENSERVGTFELNNLETDRRSWSCREMLLSQDCKTVTLLLSDGIYGWVESDGALQLEPSKTYVVSLDVSDPKDIQLVGKICISGTYTSCRQVDGKLLVMTNFYNYSQSEPDYGKPETYLPCVGTPEHMIPVEAEQIAAPDVLNNTSFAVFAMLDGKSLETVDAAAFLSYSDILYVSQKNIYTTRTVWDSDGNWDRSITEIGCIGYDSQGFTQKGTARVAGRIENQYYMDERDDVLRIVTTTNEVYRVSNGTEQQEPVPASTVLINADLTCLSVGEWEVLAQVKNFTVDGETVESVRFDGDQCYVCTAVVQTMTDPVFVFDLSDLNDITWKQTPEISGYSSSLVDYGDLLLGVGFSDSGSLKLELYEPHGDDLVPVWSIEERCNFSTSYKSYFVDREHRLFGLGVWDMDTGKTEYRVYTFGRYTDIMDFAGIIISSDPVMICGVYRQEFAGDPQEMRATLIDGYLYLLGDDLRVERLSVLYPEVTTPAYDDLVQPR